jgi:hypothetical protein
MKRLRAAVLAVIIFVAALWPRSTHAQTGNVWYGCQLHLDRATATHVVKRTCHTYAMPREHRTRTGWKITRTRLSRQVLHSVRFPTFYVPPPPAPPLTGFEANVARWAPTIYAASRTYGVPARFIAAIMTVETHGDPSAVSSAGAIGLMQLLPGTAASLGVDPWNPTQNVFGGTHYLAMNGAATLDRSRLFYAAECFNGGPGNPAAGYGYALAVMEHV